MPIYNYECKECNYSEEIFQHINDKAFCKCPSCKKKKFRRVILTAPMGIISDPKTVKQLAEKNWSKMGSYERTEIIDKGRTKEKKSMIEHKKLMKKISKLTPEEKQKYIETGII